MSFSKTINIFFSYAVSARQDKNLFDALKKHLAVLKLQGCVEVWHDSAISAGSNLRQVSENYISKSDIIVLLISSDFIASEHCREVEMKRAFERREAGTARVISVLLRPADWEALSLEKSSRLLPLDRKPVSSRRERDTALLEVAKGIRQVVEELSAQFVSSLTRSSRPKFPLWNVPHRRNPFFTGREDVLASLHNHFASSQTSYTLIQALSGLGGIGKTQLAIEYAYRYQHEYRAVFWIRADSRDLFYSDIASLADLLSFPEKNRVDEQALFASVKRWLQRQNKWLLLLDNLEDFTLVDLLISPQCSGHVLLTTRTQATGSLARALAIIQMTIDESALFLLRRAKILDKASNTDYTQATYIAQAVDGFPLALDQAGAYIEETQKSLAEYLTLYHQRQAALLKRRGQFPDGHPESVDATLSLTFERVAQIHPVAMELLQLFAFLHPDAIPDEMITQGAAELNKCLQELAADPLALDIAMATLLSFSLVRRHADTTTSSIHRIVQAILKDDLSLEQQRQWAISVVRLVNHIFPVVDFSTWSLCQRYLPQAQICAEYITTFHITLLEAASLLHRLGSYCYERALYIEAEKYLTHALTLREQELGADHLETARTLNALATLYRQQGHFHAAEILQERALAIHELILGPEHPETITTLNNRAILYQDQGNYQQAESLYQRALVLREAVLEPGHPDIAQSLNNLAILYQDQGNYQQAEPLLLRALDICEQSLGLEHPDTAQSLNNLAILYRIQEKYQLVEPLYQRAIAIYEQTVGPEHPDTALSLNNLAFLYRVQDEYVQAEPLYRRALAIYEQALGPEHPNTALTLNNLGNLFLLQGNDQQAEPLLQRALAIYEQTFGPDHPEVASTLSNLAELYILQNKYQQAASLYQRAVAIDEQTLGPEHPDTVLFKENYAILLAQMQKMEETPE